MHELDRSWTGKRIAITFDNGPDPDCTPQVLRALAARQIRSTFFVCAQGNSYHPAMPAMSAAGRALLDQIVEAGHAIGNHTLTHTVELGTTVDSEVLIAEIDRNHDLLGEYVTDRLFRPYLAGGMLGVTSFSQAAIDHLCRGRYTVVVFNSCPGDWYRPNDWPEAAVADIDRQDHTVVVVHDIARYGGMAQLERFLDAAIERGASFVNDFPADCVPIRNGVITGELSGIVSPTAQAPKPMSIAATAFINQLPD
jgi:peptidoglycan-N-acetylglucosamine deacetylase